MTTQTNLDGYLRLKQVLKLLPISESSFRRGQKTGKYPQPVRLGSKTSAYRTSTIAKLLDDLA